MDVIINYTHLNYVHSSGTSTVRYILLIYVATICAGGVREW